MWFQLRDWQGEVEALQQVLGGSEHPKAAAILERLRERLKDEYSETTLANREAASQQWTSDDDPQVNDDATVSPGADGRGAYVMCWQWVYVAEADTEDEVERE